MFQNCLMVTHVQGGESLQLLTACGSCMSCVSDDKRASMNIAPACIAKPLLIRNNIMAPTVSSALPNPHLATCSPGAMLTIVFFGLHSDKHVVKLMCATQVLARILPNPMKRSAASGYMPCRCGGFLRGASTTLAQARRESAGTLEFAVCSIANIYCRTFTSAALMRSVGLCLSLN